MREEQLTLFDDNPEYDAFVDKFKPKLTTDDCYTPENVYNAVAEWVANEYGLDRSLFVRPFWPGGDYESEEYPEGCVVVDNPPFSILAEIKQFYVKRGVKFFLFCPCLTMFESKDGPTVSYLACGVRITYQNGAIVNTSFVTNLDDCLLRTVPSLYEAVKRENDKNEKAQKKQLPKYEYPDYVITAALAQKWCNYGVEYRLERKDAAFIRALDAQKEKGKAIFGSGFILSERAAAERAAAERAASERAAAERAASERAASERAAAERWSLSERERAIVATLG